MRKKIALWYCSFLLLILSVLPLFNLMRDRTLINVIIVFVWLVASSLFYIISTKLVTFSKGYTAIDAIDFYESCLKQKITIDSLENDSHKIQNIAKDFDYSQKLELSDLLELYRIGYDLSKS